MSLELDTEFRSVVFAHIQRLSDSSGGYVTSAQLNEGVRFRGQRQPIWNIQQGIYRPAFLRSPGAALSIQTSFNSPYDDRHDLNDDRIAYKYRGEDRQHYQNQALRLAMELGRPLVYFVGVSPGVYEPILPCYVTDDDPANLTFYLVADVDQLVSIADAPVHDNWPRKAYITRQVKIRLHQDRFRYLVLNAYREQCAMCRLRHVSLLDAAHIIPDRDVRGMPEVPNGLSLCRIHHGAYDVGIVGVAPDHQIHVRRDVLEEHDGPMLRYGLQELQGSKIILPRRSQDKPNPEYLAERFEQFQAA